MGRKLRIYIMSNWGLILLLALSLGLHLSMVWQGGQNQVWESPDANINWQFARLVAHGQQPVFPADSSELRQFLTPRSAIVLGTVISPAGFLGLIYMYGLLASIFGTVSLVWWSAIISTLGVLYFYLLIKSIFGQQTAWWSALVLTIHPAWWYYTDRNLLPNVLFISLLIIAMYYWHLMSKYGRGRYFVLASFFTSLGLFVRPSEIIWVATTIILYLLLQRRRLFWSSLIWMFLGCVPLILLVATNSLDLRQLILGSGYSIAQRIGTEGGMDIVKLLLPFGFHPRLIIYVFWNFVVVLMWPFTLFTVLGYLLARTQFVERRHRFYLLAWVAISCYLMLYYGSWSLRDNPDPTATTIGISYVRYLLPLYVFGIPYVAWFILSIGRDLLPLRRKIWLGSVFAFLVLFSAQTAVLQGEESWSKQRQDLYSYDRIAGRIKQEVPSEAIIMTERADKYLWPAFSVLVPQGDDHYLQAAAELLRQGRVLYYVRPSLNTSQVDDLQESWQQYDLHLGKLVFDQEGVSVYPVHLNDSVNE